MIVVVVGKIDVGVVVREDDAVVVVGEDDIVRKDVVVDGSVVVDS